MRHANQHHATPLIPLATALILLLITGCGGDETPVPPPNTEKPEQKDSSKAQPNTKSKSTDAKSVVTKDGAGKDDDGEDDGKKTDVPTPKPVDPVAKLLQARQKLDQTIFKAETDAQEHEGTIIKLWDDLRNKDPFTVFAGTAFNTLVLGSQGSPVSHDHDITIASLDQSPTTLTREQAISLLAKVKADGWKIEQTEWHHSTFHPAADGKPARSVVSTVINLEHAATSRRAVLKGDLGIAWTNKRDVNNHPVIDSLDASNFVLIQRSGKLAFKHWFTSDPREIRRETHPRAQPILVYDVDNDGLNDVITAGCNLIWRNRGNGKFEQDKLFLKPKDIPTCAVIADFNGDGHADFAGVDFDRKLYVFEGDSSGTFANEAKLAFNDRIEMPMVLTAGDVDGDGDLDLFVGQYELPYQQGQMPTPYYDANDGHPAFFLLNDGKGNFTDVTENVGLSAKRHRRTFGASFVDLDDDGDLDLVVVNDFAGLDAYLNDGHGKFADVTTTMFDARHAFGMGLTFGDYDVDGLLDFYMVGMSSTTARRLHRMGVGRKEFADRDDMRMAMTYGNRLYVRRGKKYVHAPFSADAARMGWAWGTSSVDFDNDGDEDLYVANGHISGKSAKDYCTRYWCHDVYTGSSYKNPDLNKLFGIEVGPTHKMDTSWNGYEKNALLMNEVRDGKRRFHNIGWLMGVSFEYDSRAVVTDDLDNDGRMDLLVVQNWGTIGNSGTVLHVYRNESETNGHWIGVKLREEKGGSSVGARITLLTPNGKQIRSIVTGDSYASQHSTTKHFGLGAETTIDAIEVIWSNGRVTRLNHPKADRYHTIRMPVN